MTTICSGQHDQPAGTQTFNNSGSVTNQAGQQNVYGNIYFRGEDDPLKLLPYAPQAAFNSRDKRDDPLCLPDTRVEVLRQITAWVDEHNESCIFWLSGMAGTGKSTIARTVARQCYERGCLGASFFFSRDRADVSHADMFFTSIAVQLASGSTHLRSVICEAIREHSDIASQGPRDQWTQLLLQPLSKLKANSVSSPLIIVIDALDECEGDNDIRRIIQLLAETENLGTTRLRVFLTSRPETPIRLGFRDIRGILHRDLVLDSISQTTVDHDISVFFRKSFREIRDDYEDLPADWPGDETLAFLVQRAGGLFIYAATVCRFIKGDEQWPPHDLLELVISGSRPPGLPERRHSAPSNPPTFELDKMYLQILKHRFRKVLDERERLKLSQIFKQVIGSIVILSEPLSPTALAGLLGLRKELINQRLRHLRSVIHVPEGPGLPIRLLHPSFRDFLIDEQRCCDKDFWVDEKMAHDALAQNCLKLMDTWLKRDVCDLHAPGALTSEVDRTRIEECLPPGVQYACLYWVQHLQKSGAQLHDNDQVHSFLQRHFLHWLEALSLMQSLSGGVVMIRTLGNLLASNQNNASNFLAMIQDANRFILYHRYIIERAPLQIYASALVFSPTMSVIRSLFQNENPSWIETSSGAEQSWSHCLQTLEGHTGSVYAVAFSHDGRQLVSASNDYTVRLWDAETGAHQSTLRGVASAVVFSHDGWQLASASNDHTVRLWNAETGTHQSTLRGHTGSVNTVAFSHDGRRLASASHDHTVRLWDVEMGTHQSTLRGLTRWVNAVAFSHDGRRLVSASYDHTVQLWDAETGAHQSTLRGHTGSVNAAAFSHDGRWLASVSEDRTVRLWNAETGAHQSTLKGHTSSVNAAAFSHDGRRLASASNDHTVRLWDAETGTHQSTLRGHTGPVNAVVFSHDGRRLASASYDHTVRLWDVETGAHQSVLRVNTGSGHAVVFSHDGQRLASAAGDFAVRLWDAETGAHQSTLRGHTDSVNAVVFSHDGRRLVSTSYDDTMRLWDANTGAHQSTLRCHTSWIYAVAFSHSGRWLASVSDDHTVLLWDVEMGTHQSTLRGHTGPIYAVAFSHDGRQLVSASNDHTVRLWNAETGAHQSTLRGHTDSVNAVAFSHDGRRLASASNDHTVRLWNAETGTHQSTLKGHTRSVDAVAFSHDGRRLVSASYDHTMRLWDAEMGAYIQTIEPGTFLAKLSFSCDGSVLNTEIGPYDIRKLRWSSYGLTGDRSWITWNGNNILWLPIDYRSRHSTVQGGTIATLYCGQVVIIKSKEGVNPLDR